MTNQSVHPMFLTAAGAVILTCGIAVASMTGILPSADALSGDQTALVQTQQAKAEAEAQAKAEAEAKEAALAKATADAAEAKARAEAAEAKAAAAKIAAQKAARTSSQTSYTSDSNYRPVSTSAPCYSCGQVTSVNMVQRQGDGSGLGAVAGGVTGAVIGKQFGGGNGKKALTIAGAIGGAILGNTIEKNARATAEYQVAVRFEDGSNQTFSYPQQPQWRQGDRVKVVNGQLMANL